MIDFPRAYEKLSSLPISSFLNEICLNLKSSESRFLVLTAETAAGKSTAVPVALLEHFDGKILMLEPRRLAASAIADRVSDLLGESTGGTVGYRLHLESKVSEKTRLEVITEAILTRRLQSDPLLEDVNVIVLDEFHERSVHSDLALAFLKETMLLRDDLFVIVMSATIDHRMIAEYLGTAENPAPVMQIPGRQFPVEIEYRPNVSVAQAIYDEIVSQGCGAGASGRQDGNSILAFLPGIYEIRKTKTELENLLSNADFDTEILILHSSVSISEQRKVLCPGDGSRRVILSSAIAETSLTVPGVTIVVDSGLCRVNKMNVALGMEHLVTENESMFSAQQRSGRAGRVASGKCIRLWGEHDVRLEQNPPEILRADLTQLVLECNQWGAGEIEKLDWLTPPSKSAWGAAKFLLENLDCIKAEKDSNGIETTKITEKGKAVLRLGLHPRLACVALAGGEDAVLPFSEYADANLERQKAFLNDLKRRLSSIKDLNGFELNRISSCESKNPRMNFLLAGFPDRLARKSPETRANAERAEYQFPSGRKAFLSWELLRSHSLSSFPTWLVAPEVDAGERIGKIYSFEALGDDVAENFLFSHCTTTIKREFANSEIKDFKKGNFSIKKREITAYSELIIKEKNLPASESDFSSAVCMMISEKGLFSLPFDSHWREKIENFLLRMEFFARKANLSESDRLNLLEKYDQLAKKTTDWLSPFITNQKIDGETVFNALHWYLDGDEVDRKVPNQIVLANGRKRNVTYEKKADGTIQPSVEIIIQQIFGCFETPKILGVPVLLKLLSPASRPLQITDDLEHFWSGAWVEICKEMKGRYPKHNWDYRVSE